MINYRYEDCPLCGMKNTQYCYTAHDQFKYYRCKECKDFQIDQSRVDILENIPKEWKIEASNESKNSKYDKVLIIKLVDITKLKEGETPYYVRGFCDRANIQQC